MPKSKILKDTGGSNLQRSHLGYCIDFVFLVAKIGFIRVRFRTLQGMYCTQKISPHLVHAFFCNFILTRMGMAYVILADEYLVSSERQQRFGVISFARSYIINSGLYVFIYGPHLSHYLCLS